MTKNKMLVGNRTATLVVLTYGTLWSFITHSPTGGACGVYNVNFGLDFYGTSTLSSVCLEFLCGPVVNKQAVKTMIVMQSLININMTLHLFNL